MKASETAIVFIEFQNDFCKEGGALYEGVKDQIKAQYTIKNAQDCIEKARGKCLTLIVPILFDCSCAGFLVPLEFVFFVSVFVAAGFLSGGGLLGLVG